jgi:hypothetical protein
MTPARAFSPAADASFRCPPRFNYSDFYASIHHANVEALQADQPLPTTGMCPLRIVDIDRPQWHARA